MQGVRDGLYPGDADRNVYGVLRRRVCSVLQLRTVHPHAGSRGRGDSMREQEQVTQASTTDPELAQHHQQAEPLTKEQQVLQRLERVRRRKARLREERITMAHGAGGKATLTLIEALFLEAFHNPLLA